MSEGPPTERDPLVGSNKDSRSIQDDKGESSNPTTFKNNCVYVVGAIIVFLALLLYAILSENEGVDTCRQDTDCKGEKVCCDEKGLFPGKCMECCIALDCISKISSTPPGEWGKPYCLENQCQANYLADGQVSPSIATDGYQVWAPSETIDNSKEFRPYKVPRILHSEKPAPVLEQLWYIDFKEQRDDFPLQEVSYNGTHIMIPTYEYLHAGYSKSYNQYDEHETGIATFIMADNTYSMVSDYPAVSFVEKYHTLTYKGKKDFSRGDDALVLSKKHKEEKWNAWKWKKRALAQVAAVTIRKSILSQVESGIDRAVTWQIRRFVNSHKPENTGKLNPTTSSAWAEHAEKAKSAIQIAKDPNFEREYLKSEQHCKHIENKENIGVAYNDTHVILPLGRPATMFSGEMVNAPVHYLGLGVGYTTFAYDESTQTLQIYYQVHSISRQYPDPKYPGPYKTGLYLSPVAEGSDYEIDINKEGRSNIYLQTEQPQDDRSMAFNWDEANFAVWNRPQSEICEPEVRDGDWWLDTDIKPEYDNIWDDIYSQATFLKGVAVGILCAPIWMRADYGAGSHRLDVNEIGVWGHLLGEVRADRTKSVGAGSYWDNWECFYQNKDYSVCEDRGLYGT